MAIRPRILNGLLVAGLCAEAIQLDLGSIDSIKSAASTIAYDMMTYYSGNDTGNIPGLLPAPYYWWEAGAMLGSLIDYWYYTGDDSYNDIVTQAMLFQIGPNADFMPPNQTSSLGNDDQAFWGIAAMSAAELKFPNPPPEQAQWLALAQAVFNSQALRWDQSSCGGGLRWQIFPFNNGYDYKNSISNGCFFNLAARLGAYTGNQTYFEWANRAWDWMQAVGMMTPEWNLWDGSSSLINCSEFSHVQWTYNSGVFLLGAGVMWNQTSGAEQSKWETAIQGIYNQSSVIFFNNSVMFESACEPNHNCDTDQLSFKAYFSRWMAATTKVVPWTHDLFLPLLAASAKAAAQSCTGGANGVTCGTRWTIGGWDNTQGVGQQMSALEVILSNLIPNVSGPVTNSTGGTSKGNPSAGTQGDLYPGTITTVITTADKAGAAVLTTLCIVFMLSGAWWMID